MAWKIAWCSQAEAALLNMPHWEDASRVATAVHRFANSGDGDVRGAQGQPRTGLWLRVAGYKIWIRLDRRTRTINVIEVWPD